MSNKIICGDCVDVLKTFPAESFDSCVCDPPYGLEFMGKEWDAPWKDGKASKEFNTSCAGKLGGFKQLPNHSRVNNLKCLNCGKWKFSSNPCNCDNPLFPNARLEAMNGFQKFTQDWATEALRVLKPGGYLLSFGGTRTFHRMACAIEDAGFEIRDTIMWVYGSGFPKSLSIGKAVDKLQGNEREVVGMKRAGIAESPFGSPDESKKHIEDTKGNSPYEGWGTALKPACEPICMARKPLGEKTVALNVLKYGTGGINVDGSRVGENPGYKYNADKNGTTFHGLQGERIKQTADKKGEQFIESNLGRFPANLIHDGSDEVLAGFPNSKAGKNKIEKGTGGIWNKGTNLPIGPEYGDNGSAARFFYCAKASKGERNRGCEGLAEKEGIRTNAPRENEDIKTPTRTNNHPTVKPLSLMRYLVKLVTPPNGTVLDPFAGSGSTLVAAKELGFNFIGIEKEKDYVEIAERRIASALSPLL